MSYCSDWFAPNVEADKWAEKVKIVKTPFWYYEIKNIPCWDYTFRTDADDGDSVTKILTTYHTHVDPRSGMTWDCWYGVCRHHARAFTVMFQERERGQYTMIDGKYLKAMYVRSPPHVWLEVFIKDEGYFHLDVGQPHWLCKGKKPGKYMGNIWNCGDKTYGLTSYNPEWAGVAPTPPVTPSKTYIKATSSPTGASIWLKKH